MNVFWVLAHPEARSLNGALHDAGLAALREAGHEVEVSDLYAMKWNPVVDRADYGIDEEARLHVGPASLAALERGTLSPDVLAEQAKLERADLVVLQFPLWWFGLPAILKGWIDRVFVRGFAYGLPDPERPGRSLRYGTPGGPLAGKRALAVVTVGGPQHGYEPRGIDGPPEELLFPLLHGAFFYTGMSVLPPHLVYSANHLSEVEFKEAGGQLRSRLLEADSTEPLGYRTQNSGDYDEHMMLRPDLAPGTTGLGVHLG